MLSRTPPTLNCFPFTEPSLFVAIMTTVSPTLTFLHFRLLFENPFQFLINLQFEVEIEGKVIYGGQITLPVNLQVPQHRVSHLSDHHVLERTAYRNEEENENNPDRHKRGCKQRPSLVSREIPESDFK